MRVVGIDWATRWKNWKSTISYTFWRCIEETSCVLRGISTSAVARFTAECVITAFLAIMVGMLVLSCQQEPPRRADAKWCAQHFCMAEATVFTPVGEDMHDILERDLERIKVATGRYDLTIDPQAGIPVTWSQKPLIEDDQGNHACGQTDISGFSHRKHGSLQSEYADAYTQIVWMDKNALFCPPVEVGLLHELIHALAPKAHHVETDDSLFSEVLHRDYLDELALARLCSYFACDEFNPETEAPKP